MVSQPKTASSSPEMMRASTNRNGLRALSRIALPTASSSRDEVSIGSSRNPAVAQMKSSVSDCADFGIQSVAS
eukprot:6207318-Pleurochrysis_carterae.AAC.2